MIPWTADVLAHLPTGTMVTARRVDADPPPVFDQHWVSPKEADRPETVTGPLAKHHDPQTGIWRYLVLNVEVLPSHVEGAAADAAVGPGPRPSQRLAAARAAATAAGMVCTNCGGTVITVRYRTTVDVTVQARPHQWLPTEPPQDETAEVGISGLLVDPWVQAELMDAYCALDCYEDVPLDHPAVRLADAALPWDSTLTLPANPPKPTPRPRRHGDPDQS
jgi:hypothetical protein